MNIHEYQAKQLFADAGVAVPNGTVAQSEQEFDQALSGLPDGKAIVVKAQIHAGGRGKGTFKDGYQGGVHVVSSPDEALEKAKAMLGNVLVTKQTGGLLSFLSSNTSYDPDRLAFDQQNLRSFYLTEGYADFRVVSAVAELTPDKEDFIITYVVEEGERYKFGQAQ